MDELKKAKYVSFTTFRKNGEPKPAPVWIAPLGENEFGFQTPVNAWKVKRLRNNPDCEVQVSDMKGRAKPGARVYKATAIVDEAADKDRVAKAIRSKYPISARLIAASRVFRRGEGDPTPVTFKVD